MCDKYTILIREAAAANVMNIVVTTIDLVPASPGSDVSVLWPGVHHRKAVKTVVAAVPLCVCTIVTRAPSSRPMSRR